MSATEKEKLQISIIAGDANANNVDNKNDANKKLHIISDLDNYAQERSQNAEKITRKSNTAYKLHLALDRRSHARLVHLKGQLRAASFVEVIRRAFDAYEIYEPENDEAGNITQKVIDQEASNISIAQEVQGVKHVYLNIPEWMKEYLDMEKEKQGKSYAETVRQALRVLMQLVRMRDKLLKRMNREGSEQRNTEATEPSVHYALALV